MRFALKRCGLIAAIALFPALVFSAVPEGQPAPKVSMKLLKDGVVSDFPGWEAYRGKVVVLELWGTWCAPCVVSMPHMNALQKALEGKPIAFISVTDESADLVRKFLKRNPMAGTVAVGGVDAIRIFGTGKFPQTVLISRTGTVLRYTDPSQLSENTLGQLLDKGSVSGIKRILPDEGKSAPKEKSSKEKTDTPPLFEVLVATDNGERGSGSNEGPNSVERIYQGFDLPQLLTEAYGTNAQQIEISSGIARQRFNFRVRTPKSSENMLKPLLRQAIKAAYGAEVRRVKKEKQVLVLTYNEATPHGGLSPSGTGSTAMKITDKYIIGTNTGINDILKIFENLYDMPMVDETGLTGRYDIELDGALKDKDALNAAIKDQLGMTLTPASRSIEVLEAFPADTLGDDSNI